MKEMNPLIHTMLFRLTQKIREWQDPLMHAIGLTHGQPRVLRYISLHDGCKQTDIANYYNIKASTVSKIVDDLEKSGFLEKRQAENSRRSASLSLTKEGRTCFEKANAIQIRMQKQMLSGFSEEETEQFRDFIEKVTKNLGEGLDETVI